MALLISVLIGLTASMLIYLVNGSKLAVLMIIIIFMLLSVFRMKGDFFSNLALGITAFVFVIFMIPDSELTMWAKSILINRTLATPGWNLVHYYEFFSEYGFTFYGHINLINFFLDNYPYGDLSLGQLIGLEYSGTADANFNANFLSSDGIASLGIPGLFVASFFVGVFLNVLDVVSRKFDMQFLFISTVGFWQILMNAPFSVALLSGGGLLFIILLVLARSSFKGVL